MAESWATFGIDLHLELAGKRVLAGLETAVRDAVRTGRLHPGSELPSSRVLALDLGIARNTVSEAYTQLVAEGWLTARRGSGTRVTRRDPASRPSAALPLAAADPSRPRFDLRTGMPDPALFPRTGWLAASRRALSSAPNQALGYTDPRGRGELRRALAEYLARSRGVHADPELIVICSGFTQGLGLLCRVLHSRGATRLAVEAYGLPLHREVAVASGLALKPLPVDNDGVMLDQAGDAEAMLLTPAHQFPLGVVLGPERRHETVGWARAGGHLVIEDDYDGEFRYDRQPVGALQALDPDHVVYAGSASKSLAPGLRLGWLVVPPHLIDDVTSAKRLADVHSSTLDQLALAEFIASGAYDHHVRRSRLAYRRRRDRLAAALRQNAPQVHITGIAAGLHALLELPPGSIEDDLVTRAARQGIAVEGLQAYRCGEAEHVPAIVVGYAAPPQHALTNAIARLCAILNNTAPDPRDTAP
jgi:GntR family transcriptional regulator / MocR family aminotransferase